MKEKFKIAHMSAAAVYAQLSTAERRKVGCVVVKDDTIIAIGYNGTPPGWDNRCEDAEGKTLPHVIHAEQNALDKIVRSSASSVGAEVFVTASPCMECAKRLIGAQVKAVYFRDERIDIEGIAALRHHGITVERVIL